MHLTDEQRAEAKQTLLDLERDLCRRIEQSEASSAPVDLGTPIGRVSRIDAIQGQQMSLAGLEREKERVARVRHALRQVEQPEFGACTSCKRPIGADRVLFQPEVTVCVRCA